MKKTVVVCTFLVVVLTALITLNIYLNYEVIKDDISDVELKTSVGAVSSRFPMLENHIEKTYWKGDVLSKKGIGPSVYWMKGFIEVDEMYTEQLRNSYEWIEAEIHFKKGFDQDVLEYDEYNWCTSREFSKAILIGFIGGFYFDTINGVIYFDVENL